MTSTTRTRSVLVTGASSAVGTEVARSLADGGAAVTVTYRTNEERARKLVAELEADGASAQAVPYDLADGATAAAVVDACVEAYGGLDAVVANAVSWPSTGPGPMPQPFDLTAEWQDHFVTNSVGTMSLAHAAAPWLRRSGTGRLVFVGSSVLRHAVPGSSVYCAAKASLNGLMTGLMWDLGGDGVLINVVMPGWVVDPGFLEYAATDEELSTLVREHVAKIPIGRLVGPADVASLIGYLSSPANGAVTGEVVAVTGGY
jgi:NAD(P)-dependent dehydrogenase (short-subunit alcohol dehydrogenase family)